MGALASLHGSLVRVKRSQFHAVARPTAAHGLEEPAPCLNAEVTGCPQRGPRGPWSPHTPDVTWAGGREAQGTWTRSLEQLHGAWTPALSKYVPQNLAGTSRAVARGKINTWRSHTVAATSPTPEAAGMDPKDTVLSDSGQVLGTNPA